MVQILLDIITRLLEMTKIWGKKKIYTIISLENLESFSLT